MEVYQTEKFPEFVCLYNIDVKRESIYRFKNGRLQTGNFRSKWTDGDFCFGKRTFAKTSDNGEESRAYRFYKNPSGKIEYQERILVKGQDKEWRTLTKNTFNPDKLEWIKVAL